MNLLGSIGEAAAELRSGRLTSVELVSGCLERMDRHEASLGAVVGRRDDAALAAAALADRELGSGHDRGPLHGIPIGIKDVLATADGPTTAQSLAMLPATRASTRRRQSVSALPVPSSSRRPPVPSSPAGRRMKPCRSAFPAIPGTQIAGPGVERR